MRYSIEPKDRRHVKGYGFFSFAKNIGKNIGKNISKKYSQELVGTAKKSATDPIKTAPKRATQKTAEATEDLIGNNITDKITSTSKKFKDLHSSEANNEIPKERYISSQERKHEIPKNSKFDR